MIHFNRLFRSCSLLHREYRQRVVKGFENGLIFFSCDMKFQNFRKCLPLSINRERSILLSMNCELAFLFSTKCNPEPSSPSGGETPT